MVLFKTAEYLVVGGCIRITPKSITQTSPKSITQTSRALCTTGDVVIHVVDMESNGGSDLKFEVKDFTSGKVICTGGWTNLRANQFWPLVRWAKQLGINVDYSTCDPNFIPFRKGGKI